MIERASIPEHVLKMKNVNGHSEFLMPKITDGVIDKTEKVIRIYVTKKQPLAELHDSWILPQSLGDVPVDIVEIGEVFAYVDPVPKDGRHEQVRPLMSGISVGHVSITAGTLGHLAKYTDGNIYATSNAHVLTPDPSLEGSRFADKRIMQPGKYDDPTIALNGVGEYFWHERIFPVGQESKCTTANFVMNTLNSISSMFGRKSRFYTYVSGTNYHDFAAFKIKDGIGYDQTKTYDFDLSDYTLCARLFAGNSATSILCKTKYELLAGFTPEVPYVKAPTFMTEVRKSGRTTGDTTGKVLDPSGSITVNYGSFQALIRDVVITGDMSAGGDSGSDIWMKTSDVTPDNNKDNPPLI